MKWNDLTMTQKSQLMNIFIKGGITDLDKMKNIYDSGGDLDNKRLPSQFQESYTPSPVIPDDFIYSAGMLPEVKITANTGMNDYQRAHYADTQRMKKRVAKRPDQGWVPQTMLTFASAPLMASTGYGMATGLAEAPIPTAINLGINGSVSYLGNKIGNFAIRKGSNNKYENFGDLVTNNNETWSPIVESFRPSNFIGFGNASRTVRNANQLGGMKQYAAEHAYNTIFPFSYENPIKRFGKYALSLSSGVNPLTKSKQYGVKDLNKLWNAPNQNVAKLRMELRDDAWRLYLNKPQKYNTYIQNPDGTYSYNLEGLKESYKRNNVLDDGYLSIPGADNFLLMHRDWVGGNHGGLWKHRVYLKNSSTGEPINKTTSIPNMKATGYAHLEDMWDLNPFKNRHDKISARYLEPLLNAEQKAKIKLEDKLYNTYNKLMYNKKEYDNYYNSLTKEEQDYMDVGLYGFPYSENSLRYKIGSKLQKAHEKLQINEGLLKNAVKGMDNAIGKFEVGPVIGGTPFYLKTDVPFELQNNQAYIYPSLNIPEYYKTFSSKHLFNS